jgi:signal transduction histidine kinase
VVLVSIIVLSIYAVRWMVAPLAAVAKAAASFGRSPQDFRPLGRTGPYEIIQVTDALNEMRTRICALLADRTRMLAAISHDLRTPLTRLRLRTERVTNAALREAMLGDIVNVSRLIDETLDYLRNDAQSESTTRIDLASFLTTICFDFADMGHAVTYQGPPRMPFECRSHALSRAVTNIIDNAIKHGGNNVIVSLSGSTDERVAVEVADDGPGIPSSLHDHVFQPFFKADDARRSSHGFGLGLSIARDIIARHGGAIELKPRDPNGLRVLMTIPAG